MDADLHATHRQTKQTHIFSWPSPDFAGLLRFCGPSPVLRAFSGFACSPNLCVLAHFDFYFSKKKKVEKALSTWEKPMAKNEVPYSKNAHRLFPGVSCLLVFFVFCFLFFFLFFPGGSPQPVLRRPDQIPCYFLGILAGF